MFQGRRGEVRKDILKAAVTHMAAKRGFLDELSKFDEICTKLKREIVLHNLWNDYIAENSYAAHLDYEDMIDNVVEVGKFIR